MGVISVNIQSQPATVAVVTPTVLNPGLVRAARSVFGQQPAQPIHLLIGIDVHQGDAGLLDIVRAECPPHVMLTILDLGYSTAFRHGGVHGNGYSGALRTILSFAANSRLIATLDDNDWFAPMHLALLQAAIADRDWAFSHRWLVDPATGWPICIDEWDAVGPGRGINKERFGGFAHPSTLMIDQSRCQPMLHAWSNAAFADGTGEDRLVFEALRQRPYGESPHATVFCSLNARSVDDPHHVAGFAARGIMWPQQRHLLIEADHLLATARSQLAAGDPQAGVAACERALALVPHHPPALRQLGDALAAQGDAEQAALRQSQAALLDFARR